MEDIQAFKKEVVESLSNKSRQAAIEHLEKKIEKVSLFAVYAEFLGQTEEVQDLVSEICIMSELLSKLKG